MLTLLLLACTSPHHADLPDHQGHDPAQDDSADIPTDDSAVDSQAPETVAWTLLVYLVGDNDLESYVVHDLEEMEAGLPQGPVRVLVLADRAEGYYRGDGDWTSTRLYEIVADEQEGKLASTLIEDMGELDMANPATLAGFLETAATLAPADHYALVLWNHGTGWYLNGGAPTKGIGWDDTSEDDLSIAEGELDAGLRAFTTAHGPFELIAYDACNMAFFEVGHALREHARYLVAAQTTVGMQGLQYTPTIQSLVQEPGQSAQALAMRMAQDPVVISGEWTFSATDLSQMNTVASALDAVAGLALSDDSAWEALLAARAAAKGSEPGASYRLAYLDMKDLAAQLSLSEHAELAAAGAALHGAIVDAVPGVYGSEGFEWTGGLNVYAGVQWADYYANNPGATWAQATQWDEVLLRMAEK